MVELNASYMTLSVVVTCPDMSNMTGRISVNTVGSCERPTVGARVCTSASGLPNAPTTMEKNENTGMLMLKNTK